jgi:DNA-binding winged helix-turn-helix (wHTH) protein
MQKDFYINDQFLVKPSANLLIDGMITRISRVDPVAMQLLCILAERNREVISREELTSLIRPDIEPTDDPMTGDSSQQLEENIALLRKLLQDEKKEILRSAGKRGYALHAQIANADIDDLRTEAAQAPTQASQVKTGRTPQQKWIIFLTLLIVLLLIIFGLNNYTRDMAPAGAGSGLQEMHEENDTNTVINLGPDSVIYKLVVVDEHTPKFFINGKEIPAEKWVMHEDMINSLKRQLKENNQ